MKYVRVCDEYENEYITTYQQHCEDVAQEQAAGFDFEGCIIKQADTIEELCDEFVIVDNGHCISDLYTIKRLLVKNKLLVYGAIWTDKGLIYVAKMNKKGDLELL